MVTHKNKLSKKKGKDDCPVELAWATFCKNVLAEDNMRTLHAILPSLTMQIAIPEDAPENENIQIPVGTIALYALFRRKAGFEGTIDLEVNCETNFSESNEIAFKLHFEPQHDSFQQSVRLQNGGILVSSSLRGELKHVAKATFKYGEQILGNAELGIRVKVKRAGNEQTTVAK